MYVLFAWIETSFGQSLAHVPSIWLGPKKLCYLGETGGSYDTSRGHFQLRMNTIAIISRRHSRSNLMQKQIHEREKNNLACRSVTSYLRTAKNTGSPNANICYLVAGRLLWHLGNDGDLALLCLQSIECVWMNHCWLYPDTVVFMKLPSCGECDYNISWRDKSCKYIRDGLCRILTLQWKRDVTFHPGSSKVSGPYCNALLPVNYYHLLSAVQTNGSDNRNTRFCCVWYNVMCAHSANQSTVGCVEENRGSPAEADVIHHACF